MPLIDPERLAADPQVALAVLPPWVHQVSFVSPEVEPEAYPAIQPVVIIWAGETHRSYEAHTPLAAAFMWEATRLRGVSIAVNHNGVRSDYFRFTVEGFPEDLATVARVLKGADPDEQVLKTPSRKWDMRTETLATRPARKPSKDSRAVLMGHIERIAKQLEAEGRFPPHFTATEYLANLVHLLHLIDQEARGKELHDLVAATIKASRGPGEAGREG